MVQCVNKCFVLACLHIRITPFVQTLTELGYSRCTLTVISLSFGIRYRAVFNVSSDDGYVGVLFFFVRLCHYCGIIWLIG